MYFKYSISITCISITPTLDFRIKIWNLTHILIHTVLGKVIISHLHFYTYNRYDYYAETMREGRMEGKKMRERQILLDWMTVDGYSKLR